MLVERMYTHISTTAEDFTVLNSFIVAQYVTEIQKVNILAHKHDCLRNLLILNFASVKVVYDLIAQIYLLTTQGLIHIPS